MAEETTVKAAPSLMAPGTQTDEQKRAAAAKPEIEKRQAALVVAQKELDAINAGTAEFDEWADVDMDVDEPQPGEHPAEAVKRLNAELRDLDCFVTYPLPWTLKNLKPAAYRELAVTGGFLDSPPNTKHYAPDLSPSDLVVKLHNAVAGTVATGTPKKR